MKSGKVSVRRNGEELATFGPNDEFGEMAALSTRPRIADAIALEDTVCYTLASDDFRLNHALRLAPLEPPIRRGFLVPPNGLRGSRGLQNITK